MSSSNGEIPEFSELSHEAEMYDARKLYIKVSVEDINERRNEQLGALITDSSDVLGKVLKELALNELGLIDASDDPEEASDKEELLRFAKNLVDVMGLAELVRIIEPVNKIDQVKMLAMGATRRALGLKQSDVAKILGVTRQTVSNYERGITDPGKHTTELHHILGLAQS